MPIRSATSRSHPSPAKSPGLRVLPRSLIAA